MSSSNRRNTSPRTYHHLISRIAHKVYFMTDEVRNDFIEMIRRSADFCGIQLVAWCIMSNHFHILAYLPEPEHLDESEILRRYGVLKGKSRRSDLEKELAKLRGNKDVGESAVAARLSDITASMHKIGVFMKIVKQWLTQDYNRRYSHAGTLWESVYKDILVPDRPGELAKRAAYIHLNPVRAAIGLAFDEYAWSSLTALRKGDDVAIRGMRRIYGEEASPSEMLDAHKHLMAELLEQIKFERAVDVARRRDAGFEQATDPLTDEALVAQAAEHLKRVMDASVEDKAIRRTRGRPKNMTLLADVSRILRENPKMPVASIAEAAGCPLSTAYACIRQIHREENSKKSRTEV